MKTMMILAFSLIAGVAQASSLSQQNCTLSKAPNGGTAADVQTVAFSKAQSNAIGSLERKATLGSLTVTLGEAGPATYINLQDSETKAYFASAFSQTALYATSTYTLQVMCR